MNLEMDMIFNAMITTIEVKDDERTIELKNYKNN